MSNNRWPKGEIALKFETGFGLPHEPTEHDPKMVEQRFGEAICWLRLLATRFDGECPHTSNAARRHADFIEQISDALHRAGLIYTSQGFGCADQSFPSDATKRMAKTLGAEFVPHQALSNMEGDDGK